MKKFGFILAVLLLMTAAGCSRGAPVQESLVQVWSDPSAPTGATSLASGVVVGDGLHVLTLMTFVGYVRYKPGPLQVAATGGKRYDATIEKFDPQTGFTVLRLQSALTAGAVGQVTGENETVLTWEWNGSRWTVTNRMRVETIPGRPPDPSFFYITTGDPLYGPLLSGGTVVTDEAGKVLGLAEPLEGPHLAIPPAKIASIGVGMALLNSGDQSSE